MLPGSQTGFGRITFMKEFQRCDEILEVFAGKSTKLPHHRVE